MSGKIEQFFYPFEELKQVIVTGNDPVQDKIVVNHIQQTIEKQSGSLAHIRHLFTGIENKGTQEEFLYLYNRYMDAGCIKFVINAEENVHSKLNMDLLIINLSFSTILPHLHDESDKYELGDLIKRSKNYDCARLYLLNINRTLLTADHPAKMVSQKLQELMNFGNFGKAKDILNEKGIRQMTNVHNYLVNYFPFYKKEEKILEDVQVVYFNEKPTDDEIPALSFYTKLLNLDTTTKSTINRY